MFSRCVYFLGLFSLVMVLAGCADQYGGRMEVSGKVKLVNEPLKDGAIEFVPLEQTNLDTKGGGAITNGEYKIPRKNGLKPGKYLVRLTSGDGKTPATNDEAASPGGSTNIVSVDRIPEDWNVNSQHKIDVTSNGSNKFDFEVPNLNPRLLKQKKR